MRNRILLASFTSALLAVHLHAAEAIQTEANRPAEITFLAGMPHEDPFNEIILDVVFTDPAGKEMRVPAFWAGKSAWKVRYSSPITGKHQYKTECNLKDDTGLNGVEGDVEIRPYTGTNALYLHGPVRVAEDHRHFAYADGTPFFWLGDTWWMGLCKRIEWPGEFQILTSDRVAKGFTVVQIVAGLYPDMPPFDPRGANEAGFPWETNYARIRPEYFDEADHRLNHLVDSGITPCLVGAWGYFIPWMGVEKARQHWRYLVARYGAYPMFWCAAGEANLPYYLVKGFPFDDRKQVADWTQVMESIRKTDPFHRPLSIHPTGLGKLSARGSVNDQSVLDFDMLQTGHGLREVLGPTVATVRASWQDRPMMPVVDSEVAYEMLSDRIPADVVRLMFWACMLNGAAGHTYGANGIWQCNRSGQPHGASPHGGNYGSIPWNEAMKLPGSDQLGQAKGFLETFDWTKLEPQSETVSWVSTRERPVWGQWIWYPEGNPKADAPAEARYFRRAFALSQDSEVKHATLNISADDAFKVWLNGNEIGGGSDWRDPGQYDVTKLLFSGTNVVSVRAVNAPAAGANPAGLIVGLSVEFKDGKKVFVGSDAKWKSSKAETADWTKPGSDESGWQSALALGKYGEAPWGRIGSMDNPAAPYAAGIADRFQIIYACDPRPVRVTRLQPRAQYRVTHFDPATGKRFEEPTPWVAPADTAEFPPPATDHDWVLVLELKAT